MTLGKKIIVAIEEMSFIQIFLISIAVYVNFTFYISCQMTWSLDDITVSNVQEVTHVFIGECVSEIVLSHLQ